MTISFGMMCSFSIFSEKVWNWFTKRKFRFYAVLYDFFPEQFIAWRLRKIFAAAEKTFIYRSFLEKGRNLKSFPVTDKQFFKGRPFQDWIVQGVSSSRLSKWRTSGSTGEPFEFFRDEKYSAVFYEWNERGLQWLNQDKLRKVYIMIDCCFERSDKNNLYIPLFDFEEKPAEYLRIIRDFKPDYLFSFPSVLLETIEIIKNKNFERPAISYIGSTGEMLTDKDRLFIENFFKSEIFNIYGSEEFGTIAVECREHKGFHLKEESFLLEILSEKDGMCPAETTGRIVLTHFDNEVAPFIRYDTGDAGYFLGKSCPCGSGRPLFNILGRSSTVLKLRDRSLTHWHFYALFRQFGTYIKHYQVVYKSRENILLAKIVPQVGFEKIEPEIRKDLAALSGNDVKIIIESVVSIPRTGRKHRTFLVR